MHKIEYKMEKQEPRKLQLQLDSFQRIKAGHSLRRLLLFFFGFDFSEFSHQTISYNLYFLNLEKITEDTAKYNAQAHIWSSSKALM